MLAYEFFQQEFHKKREQLARSAFQVREHGIKPDPTLSFHEPSLALVFRYDGLADIVAELSSEISSAVPSKSYDAALIHTKVFRFPMPEGGCTEFSQELIEHLAGFVPHLQAPRICYSKVGYDEHRVKVLGLPNRQALEAIAHLYHFLRSKAIQPENPHSAEILVCKFTEQRAAEQLHEFFRLMQRSPELGSHRAACLQLAYCKGTEIHEIKASYWFK